MDLIAGSLIIYGISFSSEVAFSDLFESGGKWFRPRLLRDSCGYISNSTEKTDNESAHRAEFMVYSFNNDPIAQQGVS